MCGTVAVGDFVGLGTTGGTGDDIEANGVAFFQRPVTGTLNRAVVGEDIGASVVPADEPIAFRIVEPLDCAFVLRHEGRSLYGVRFCEQNRWVQAFERLRERPAGGRSRCL